MLCVVWCTSTHWLLDVSMVRSTRGMLVRMAIPGHCSQWCRSLRAGTGPRDLHVWQVQQMILMQVVLDHTWRKWSRCYGGSEYGPRLSGLAGYGESSPGESQSSQLLPLAAEKASWAESGPHKRCMRKQDAPRKKGAAASPTHTDGKVPGQ